MSRHQKPSSSSFLSNWFPRQYCRMGSFPWDDEFSDFCCTQRVNGRPLSVVLTEPYDPFEPQPSSFFDDIPCIESDFATLRRHHHHHHHQHFQQQQQQQQHRSRSSGRRFKREYYSFQHPNVTYNSYCFSPPPPPPHLCRSLNRAASREVLIEKIETVTVEEQQRRPPPYSVSFVRAPSPPIRQLKIRPRPSSCFDLHQESTKEFHQQQQKENRWSKVVDEHREEHFEYNYNYNFKIPERVVPIERELPPPPPPPPRTVRHDATTSTEDLYIPPPLPPKQIRPETRDTGTTTAGLPKRPLCVTETQVIERFEKTEKVRCDSTSSTEGPGSDSSATIIRLLPRSSDDGDFAEKYSQRASKKAQRKDFVERMHVRNGTLATKACNAINVYYSPVERRRGKSRVIVRPTSHPREILVDTCGIFGTPGEFSEPTSPQTIENGSTIKSRSPFQPPDLL